MNRRGKDEADAGESGFGRGGRCCRLRRRGGFAQTARIQLLASLRDSAVASGSSRASFSLRLPPELANTLKKVRLEQNGREWWEMHKLSDSLSPETASVASQLQKFFVLLSSLALNLKNALLARCRREAAKGMTSPSEGKAQQQTATSSLQLLKLLCTFPTPFSSSPRRACSGDGQVSVSPTATAGVVLDIGCLLV